MIENYKCQGIDIFDQIVSDYDLCIAMFLYFGSASKPMEIDMKEIGYVKFTIKTDKKSNMNWTLRTFASNFGNFIYDFLTSIAKFLPKNLFILFKTSRAKRGKLYIKKITSLTNACIHIDYNVKQGKFHEYPAYYAVPYIKMDNEKLGVMLQTVTARDNTIVYKGEYNPLYTVVLVPDACKIRLLLRDMMVAAKNIGKLSSIRTICGVASFSELWNFTYKDLIYVNAIFKYKFVGFSTLFRQFILQELYKYI